MTDSIDMKSFFVLGVILIVVLGVFIYKTSLPDVNVSAEGVDVGFSAVLDDVSECDLLDDDLSVKHCRDNYYFAKRFNTDNLSFCDKIVNEVLRNECIK